MLCCRHHLWFGVLSAVYQRNRNHKGAFGTVSFNSDDLLYYDRYDIADLPEEGKNVIGILLGNGILNAPGGGVWDFDKASYCSAPKVALALELEYEGKKEVITAASFTYFGMRYCLVSGITKEQATEELMTFEVLSSDLKVLEEDCTALFESFKVPEESEGKPGSFLCNISFKKRLLSSTVKKLF